MAHSSTGLPIESQTDTHLHSFPAVNPFPKSSTDSHETMAHGYCGVCVGKQIQMNRMAAPEGDEGGGAQARVNVLADLPLLEARLDAPSLRTTDVDQSQVHPCSFMQPGFGCTHLPQHSG